MALEILAHIERLKADWMALQPMDPSHAAKLHQKMRLEWNYNSNHIEGNTLTYGETELLLIFDQTKGDHEFREYEEMKGHDVALKMVEDLAKDKERELTESFICNLNKLLLKEPFYKEAITPDGQPTRRLIKIGEYKSHPNSVRLQNGKMFHYASPAETPAKMHDLLQWYRQVADEGKHHPITLAAELHYRFVLIHPFDDGNGRISRLLMNYHLLRNDYPPVIIKSADKKNYLRALNEADTGNVAAFIDYVAEQLIWSYEISIKAAKGESIDEVGDWEKKLVLLEKQIPKEKALEKRRKELSLSEALNNITLPIIQFLLTDLASIRNLFFENTLALKFKGGSTTHGCNFDCIKDFFNTVIENGNVFDFDTISFDYRLIGFKNNGSNTFDLIYTTHITFEEYSYTFRLADSLNIDKYYHQTLTETDKDLIASKITEDIIQKVGES